MAARATVIIPTFGQAPFARWAIESVQKQTIQDLEICIVCDGSPEPVVTFFETMARADPRIQVFTFPKSPRTGEPYRDFVIQQTTGRIIGYCSHDDLWLPHHLQAMEDTLKKCRFAHSLHAAVNLPEDIRAGQGLLHRIHLRNIKDRHTARNMLAGINLFGLTYGAHTRDAYFELAERWVTTPREDVATDLYMWCKFLTAFPRAGRTIMRITALNFPHLPRKAWSPQQRNDELQYYADRIQDSDFLKMISRHLLRLRIRRSLRL